jgi:hypothetical protein
MAKVAKKAASRAANGKDRVLRVIAKENPRRKGTAAYKFYEAMAKSKTVGDYLKRFKDPKDRRNASLWLSASARQGHVKVAA